MTSRLDNWILWDFDGTLAVRNDGGWTSVLTTLLRQHVPDCLAGYDDIRPHMDSGFPWHEPQGAHPHLSTPQQWWRALECVFVRAYTAVGLPASRAKELAGKARELYIQPSCWTLYDDTLPVLRRLKEAGWRHAILSNHCPELPDIVRGLGLGDMISHVINSAATGYEKPHPQMFRIALETIAPAGRVWMVGDNPQADVAGAIAAGIPAILVRKRHASAQRFCADLSKAAAMIEGGRNAC